MVAVSAVDSHALEAVAMMAARLLARAVVTGFAHLTQKFQLDLERFFLLALAVKVVLQDGQFVSVYFHKYRSSIYCTTSHFYHSRVLTVSSKQLYPKPCFRAVIQIFNTHFIYFAIDKKGQNKALIHRHMNEGFYFQISIDPLFPTGYFPSHLDWYSVVFSASFDLTFAEPPG